MDLPGPAWALFLVGFGLLELLAPEVVVTIEELAGVRSWYARRPSGRHLRLRRGIGLLSLAVGVAFLL